MTHCPAYTIPCPHVRGSDRNGLPECDYDKPGLCPGERHQIALAVKPWPASEKVLEEAFHD